MVVCYEIEGSPPGGLAGVYTLYGKLYRGHAGERACGAYRLLAPHLPPRVRLAEVLGYDPRWRFLLLEGLYGELLGDVLRREGAHAHLASFGEILAEFHTCGAIRLGAGSGMPGWPQAAGVCPLRVHDGEAEGRILELARARAQQAPWEPAALTSFTACVDEAMQALRSGSPAGSDRGRTVVHRDLYPQQVLLSARRTPAALLEGPCEDESFGLLDLDEVSCGEPEIDCGNFIAHLFLDDLQTLGCVRVAPTRVLSFLAAYTRRAAIRPERLRAYTAGSLMRLASLERISLPASSVLRWPALASALVAVAQEVLAGGLPGSI